MRLERLRPEMGESLEQCGAHASSSHVVTFYSSTADEVEQHFARALAHLRSQNPLTVEADTSQLYEVRGMPEEPVSGSFYGSADAVDRFGAVPVAYPPFVPFVVEPDIDATGEAMRFPEEAGECELSHYPCAQIIPQSYHSMPARENVDAFYGNAFSQAEAFQSCPELQAVYSSESSCTRAPVHRDDLLDPLGLLSDAELLRILMNC